MNTSNNQKAESVQLAQQGEEARYATLTGIDRSTIDEIQRNSSKYQALLEQKKKHKKRRHHEHRDREVDQWLKQGPETKKSKSFWKFEI